ncbi:hypothetical protein BJY04DRAFT_38638 [Aspergillus karnatakaensis]|uniref:methyltransferase family protein n=1 Tax=Aspergillus karnatakaensis TaxID=1810916 RepID=UPI003CCD70DB
MPSLKSTTLSVALLASGYLHALCTTSPHTPKTPYRTDRIRFFVTALPTLGTNLNFLAVLYQALVTLFSTSSGSDREIGKALCPYLENLNPDRVRWTTRTIGYFLLVLLGAGVRLSAYDGLGRNFTFQLATPDRLVTTGVYRYLQHPSYTGLVVASLGHAGLFASRIDTPLACLAPLPLVRMLREWEGVLAVLGAAVGGGILGVRIRDEERMLRERFGREWEIWHQKTRRLIPGVF